jgi:hypothetical protein
LNKNDYLDCLRCVTKDKILSIKEAERLFKVKVNQLIKAKDYEVENQAHYAISAAKKVFEK